MGTWGPQKAYFHAYIIHCHDPVGFAMGKVKEVLSLQMSRDHGKQMFIWTFLASFFFLCLSFLPTVSIVTKREGEEEGENVQQEATFPKMPYFDIY